MRVVVFSRVDCPTCEKAKTILTKEGVSFESQPIDGPDVTAEGLALLSWLGWEDMAPIIHIVAPEEHGMAERSFACWTGVDVKGRVVDGQRIPFTKVARAIGTVLKTGQHPDDVMADMEETNAVSNQEG